MLAALVGQRDQFGEAIPDPDLRVFIVILERDLALLRELI